MLPFAPKTTYKLKNLSTYKLINLQTNQLTNTPTEKLKNTTFILQLRFIFRSILAKKQVKK